MSIFSKVLHHERKEKLSPSSSGSFSPGSYHGHHGHHGSSKSTKSPIVLSIELESPPIILYGNPQESTGSIISGLLRVKVDGDKQSGPSSPLNLTPAVSNTGYFSNISSESEFSVEKVTLSLVQTIKYTKPFLIQPVSNCKDCRTSIEVLARWDIVTASTILAEGSHAYPFSHLLPGSLPASSKLGSYQSNSFIKYDLIAEAHYGDNETVKVELPINISRSILRGPDRNSLRVFPPTEVTASAVLPNVVYPKSQFPIELKLDNVVSDRGDRRWRMRKLSWRIEEAVKVRARACEKHKNKLEASEESQRRAKLMKELKTGSSASEQKSSVHHSTIVTSSFFGYSPSVQHQQQLQQQLQQPGGPLDVEPPREDLPPSDASGTFEEDFENLSNNTSTSNMQNRQSPRSSSRLSVRNQSSSPDAAPIELENHLYMEEIRTVSHGEIKSGWKSDFSGKGRIELVAEISAIILSSGSIHHQMKKSSLDDHSSKLKNGLRNGATIACDIEDSNSGIYVSHTLVVEVVVAEELLNENIKPIMSSSGFKPTTSGSSHASVAQDFGPMNSTSSTTSTSANDQIGVLSGSARVLRMQFKLPFTERSGLGIAWDDEVPPTYEDVRTLSPPTYIDSASSTPKMLSNGNSHTPMAHPNLRTHTPGVIYGVGNTPLTSSISNPHNEQGSIDSIVDLDDRIQEFRL